MTLKVETLLETIFKRDLRENAGFSHISQIGIVTVKSLIPSKEDLGIRLDYRRFTEELRFWKFYRSSEESLISKWDILDSDLYFNSFDNTLISRIVPLALVNQELDILEEEVIKANLYTTGNIMEIFYSLILSYKIYYLLEDLREEDINQRIKDRIIKFSQKDYFEKYGSYYRFSIEDYASNYSIDFEMAKIAIINLLNGVYDIKYDKLGELLDLEKRETITYFENRILNDWLGEQKDHTKLPVFYLELGKYLYRLRKSRINPENLSIDEYILPDIFKYNEGDEFYHSLMNNSRVLRKEVKGKDIKMAVKTKMGIYILKNRP